MTGVRQLLIRGTFRLVIEIEEKYDESGERYDRPIPPDAADTALRAMEAVGGAEDVFVGPMGMRAIVDTFELDGSTVEAL